MHEFQFRSFLFIIHPDQSWNLTHQETGINFSSLAAQVDLKVSGQKRVESLSTGKTTLAVRQEYLPLLKSMADIVTVRRQSNSIDLSVEYAFPQDRPLFLIRLKFSNQQQNAGHINNLTLIDNSFLPGPKFLTNDPRYACFVNGWQSWSFSATYSAEEKQIIPGLNFIQEPLWHDSATPIPKKKGKFSSDFLTVLIDRSCQKGLLAGFLSQKKQFGHAEVDLREVPRLQLKASGDGARILPGESMVTDWAVLQIVDFENPDPLKDYIEASALENKVEIKSEIPTGWCSWYQYYTHITPKNLLSNIHKLHEIKTDVPLELIQIDDGFEKAAGDWLECKRAFPEGLGLITSEIRAGGFTPGLWLAPFIVHPASKIYKKHPEMLLKNSRGIPVNSGWNWNAFTSSLDMSHPAAKEYIRKVIDNAVNSWGFPYLKLDFLYAATIPGKHYDPSLTRAQIFDQAMSLIRDAAGKDTYLVGCGAPIGGSIGHVDAMRIGADVASDWKPKYHGIELLFPDEPNVPAVEKALQNTITRGWFHKRWWMNDPDCLPLRSTTNLTDAEVSTQACLTAMTGGLVLLSDDLSKIPPERMQILQEIIPVIGKTPQILDWQDRITPTRLKLDLNGPTGDWHLISYTNWCDHSKKIFLHLDDFHLSEKEEWLISSFREKRVTLVNDGEFEIGELSPHATWIAAVRKHIKRKVLYAGSTLHISQGMEVKDWIDDGQQVRVQFHLPRRAEGEVSLWIPFEDFEILHPSGTITPIVRQGSLVRIPMKFDQDEEIIIKFQRS